MPDSEMSATEQKAHDEALKRIAECLRRRASVLDLSHLGLSCLPGKMGQLGKLSELNLAHNRLSSLPPEFCQLASLSRLDLSNNQLAALPPALGQLASLTLLYLANNPLAALPPELGQLTKLTRLDVSDNPLTALPPELGQLANLTRLDVSNNRLEFLPPELGGLTGLTRLYLSGNHLAALPPELGCLANLTRLYLSGNQLASLPPELGQLSRLTVLDVSINKLGTLPPELGQLLNLTELNLDNNLLCSLPPELGQLAKLTVLRLMSNRLATLPEPLAALEMLEKFFLHDNPALQLSPSVLGPDPRQLPPPRVAAPKGILDFYFARQGGRTRPLNEVKLLLLGACGVGKTSLVNALRDLPFREREESTTGIALSDLMIDGADGQGVIAHVWDCSGQPVSHLLHPVFFSPRNLYLVVLSGRDHREREEACYWLKLIETATCDEQGLVPPVIVVLNQWNVPGCRPELDRGLLREQFPFIRGFVEMDCKAKKGVSALKAAFIREFERMPWVSEPFPEEWDAVRQALAANAGHPPLLTYTEYCGVCSEHGVTDEGQQGYLAEILHHLGAVLNESGDPRRHDASLFLPHWLTKHVYALMHRAEKLAGVLRQSDVEIALQAKPAPASHSYLMLWLQRLSLAFPAQTATGHIWLVPPALPNSPPPGIDAFGEAAETVRLRYTYPSPPNRLVTLFSARRYEFIEDVNERKQLWRSGAILARKGARVLIRCIPQNCQLTLTVIGPTKLRRQLADLCQEEMRDIHTEYPGLEPLGEILLRGEWQGLTRRAHVPEPQDA
ncbi:MAG: leucine-rich repeat domain-containing protein [Verrucomicrobiota bacterium]